MENELLRTYEAINLPIDSDMLWRISFDTNGASAILVRPYEGGSQDRFFMYYDYDEIIASAKADTIAMAMSLAWAEWQHVNVRQ